MSKPLRFRGGGPLHERKAGSPSCCFVLVQPEMERGRSPLVSIPPSGQDHCSSPRPSVSLQVRPLNAKQVCRRIAGNVLARAMMDAWIKHVGIDFGTYHHSTPNESNAIREQAEKTFSKLLRSLYPSGAPLRILDAGCGLGFLMYVVAKCFPKAHVSLPADSSDGT